MSYRIQPFETLPLKHYFMFGQVMQKPEICQLFLEELFGWDIEKIEYVDREKDITDSYWGHGIRLDIYIRNSGKVYNIEMQAEKEDALELLVKLSLNEYESLGKDNFKITNYRINYSDNTHTDEPIRVIQRNGNIATIYLYIYAEKEIDNIQLYDSSYSIPFITIIPYTRLLAKQQKNVML